MAWEPDDEGLRNATEEVKRGWSASGTLRREEPDRIVSLQANFKSAEQYTLQFSIEYPEVPAGATGTTETKAIAEIAWSVAGNTIYRMVTISNGMSISGVGQGVQVRIYDATDPTGDPSSEGWEYKVSVQVSPGVRASDSIPPLFYPRLALKTNVPAGITLPYDVDQKMGAKSVFVSPQWAVAGSGTIIMSGNGGAVTIAQYPLVEPGQWLPIAPGTDQILVYNRAGSSALSFTIMYGIDG
jgi:hypothetical protein